MPFGTAQFRALLTSLTGNFRQDAKRMVSRMGRFTAREGREFLSEAFPDLVRPYIDAAGDLTVEYYDAQPSTNTVFVPQAAEPPSDEQVAARGWWGIEQPDPGDALGTAGERIVFNHSRDTVLENVIREDGARWAREARPGACAFCKLLSTRGAVYWTEASALSVTGASVRLEPADLRAIADGRLTRTEALRRRMVYRSKAGAAKAGKRVGDPIDRALRGSRDRGESYHDHCFCIAVPIRPGDSYVPPDYAQAWEIDYRDAITAAEKQMAKQGEHRRVTMKDILNGWDRNAREARGLLKPGPKPKSAAQ